ncbi:MAG: methyltransferase domain-containing protein [Phycisphaerales bacterium]|nr:MAG: methyltransferase domain-containing protein [Phycisphaerales bacterium]
MKRSPSQAPVTERLAVLSEMVRLRICRMLEQTELSVGEVAQIVQMPQSTVSRHLKLLSDGGWLVKRSEGTATLYRLIHDDLPPEMRALWLTVRAQLGENADLREDARRLDLVLSARRTDSQAFFGRVAGAWDDVRNELFGDGFTANALLALLPSEWSVADIGCGTGNVCELLAGHVRRVIAVDQSAAMLKAAKKRLRDHTNVEFVRASVEDLPLEPNSLDGAVCALLLHHVDSPAAALASIRRTLRPGGVALVIDMFEHDRVEYRHSMGHRRLGFNEEAIVEAFEEAGYVGARVVPLPGHPNAKGPSLFAATGRNPADA